MVCDCCACRDTTHKLKKRTKKFALDVIKLVETLPHDRVSYTLAGQLVRSGPSVGANYRAACRAKSTADFISKMGTVEEEADESIFWLELIKDFSTVRNLRFDQGISLQLALLLNEADQLLAITVATKKTARHNSHRPIPNRKS